MKAPDYCKNDYACQQERNNGSWQFQAYGCQDCHTGSAYRDGKNHDVGTISTASGQGSSSLLTGIRTPTLIELWDTAPYLHDGSAATLEEVFTVGDHANMGLNQSELNNLIKYIREIDQDYFIEDNEAFNP